VKPLQSAVNNNNTLQQYVDQSLNQINKKPQNEGGKVRVIQQNQFPMASNNNNGPSIFMIQPQ
jgi:hypothetical protein